MGQNHSHSKNQNNMAQLAADGQQLVVKKKKFLRRKSHDDVSQRANKKCNTNKVVTTKNTCEENKTCMINKVQETDSTRRVRSVRDFPSKQADSQANQNNRFNQLNIMENNSSEQYRKTATTTNVPRRHQSPNSINNYTVEAKQVTPVPEFLSASSTCDGISDNDEFVDTNSTQQSSRPNYCIINQLTDAMLNTNISGNEERRSAIIIDPIKKQNFASGNLNQNELEFTGQTDSVNDADIYQELAKVTFNWVDACANNVQLIVLHDEKVVSRVPMAQVQQNDDEVSQQSFRVTLVLQPGHEYQYYFMVDNEPRYSFEDNYTYMSVDVSRGSSSSNSRDSSPCSAFNSFNSNSDSCEDNQQQDLIVNQLLLLHDVRYHHHYQYYENKNCNYINNCCKHLIACGDEVPDNSATHLTTTNTTTTTTTMTIWPIDWFIIPMPIRDMSMMMAEDVFAMELNQFTRFQQQQQCSMVSEPKRKPVVKKPKSKKKVHFGVACFFDYQ